MITKKNLGAFCFNQKSLKYCKFKKPKNFKLQTCSSNGYILQFLEQSLLQQDKSKKLWTYRTSFCLPTKWSAHFVLLPFVLLTLKLFFLLLLCWSIATDPTTRMKHSLWLYAIFPLKIQNSNSPTKHKCLPSIGAYEQGSHLVKSTTPRLSLSCTKWPIPNGFVKMSASCCSDLQNSILISPFSTNSLLKWYLISIYLLLPWKTRFLDTAIEEMLS